MKKKINLVTTVVVCLFALALYMPFGCNSSEAKINNQSAVLSETQVPPLANPVSISSTVPSDIPGGAQSADLKDAATYAWQLFIALNWPAKEGVRDTPDKTKLFGDSTYSGSNGLPLVWHTYRSKVEIYPDSKPNGYVNDPSASYGYDSPPDYLYTVKVIPGIGQPPVTAQPPWINLDEISQISLDKMYAGILSGVPHGNNTAPQLIRFTPKANRKEYEYIAKNQWWGNKNKAYNTAVSNFTNAITQTPPAIPKHPIVQFPDGTIETKSAWRPLGPKDDGSRFYTTKVRFYEEENDSTYYYYDEEWALIALHIIVKTKTAPYFIFATFEQADNIQTPDGKPVEDENGNIINPPSASGPTTPGLMYMDSPTLPTLNVSGAYCPDTTNVLYYQNESSQSGLPSDGDICVNRRINDIPDTVISVNKAAHNAIMEYNTANHIPSSPWLYYKLVNVQWKPFDKSMIDRTDPNGDFNSATFYQANIVVETNYTLQMFSGRQIKFFPSKAAGLPTDYPKFSSSGSKPDFKNVYTFRDTVIAHNMGGCMGCHGNAQVAGNDFSFILQNGPFTNPEGASTSSSDLMKKYIK